MISRLNPDGEQSNHLQFGSMHNLQLQFGHELKIYAYIGDHNSLN